MECLPLHVVPWIRNYTPPSFVLLDIMEDPGRERFEDAFFVDEQSFVDDTVIVGSANGDVLRAPAHLANSLSDGTCLFSELISIEHHL